MRIVPPQPIGRFNYDQKGARLQSGPCWPKGREPLLQCHVLQASGEDDKVESLQLQTIDLRAIHSMELRCLKAIQAATIKRYRKIVGVNFDPSDPRPLLSKCDC